MKQWIYLFIGSLLFWSCGEEKKSSETPLTPFYYDLPAGFSFPQIPKDNPMFAEKIELGRKLFFDPVLSRDNSVSCGSCHLPEKGFSDTVGLSLGADKQKGERNAPPLFNVAYKKDFFKDGGIPTLELQVLAPFDNELELDMNIVEATERLKKIPHYKAAFKRVFGREPDPFGLTRAIAAYERTLISGNSAYDEFVYGKKEALSASAQRGMKLFASPKLGCNNCHSGQFFTNGKYENNGLYETYKDTGVARITLKLSDVGRFNVPTLRNIELTGPYMFDGSLKTLGEVIDHYTTGGKNHPNKSSLIQPFTLTNGEKQDLINFLKSLTDQRFVKKHKEDSR